MFTALWQIIRTRSRMICVLLVLVGVFACGVYLGRTRWPKTVESTTIVEGPKEIKYLQGPSKIQRVYRTVYVKEPPAAPVEKVVGTQHPSGEWTFKSDDLAFTFNPVSKQAEYSITQRFRVSAELNLSTKQLTGTLFEVRNDKVYREVAVESWELVTLEAAVKKPSRIKQCLGVGVSVGSFTEAQPALTYSFLRLGRIKIPSFLAELPDRVGAGVQYQVWKPVHIGAFYTVKIGDTSTPEGRFTFTLNF